MQFMDEMRALRALVSHENGMTRSAVETLRQQTATDYRAIRDAMDKDRAEAANGVRDVRETLTEVLERLASGSERFDGLIHRIEAVELRGDTTALVKRPVDTSSSRIKLRRKAPWWLLAAAGGALAFAGERAYKWAAFIASQEPPAATAPTIKP
jgi:hypothetical protein